MSRWWGLNDVAAGRQMYIEMAVFGASAALS